MEASNSQALANRVLFWCGFLSKVLDQVPLQPSVLGDRVNRGRDHNRLRPIFGLRVLDEYVREIIRINSRYSLSIESDSDRIFCYKHVIGSEYPTAQGIAVSILQLHVR